MRVDYGDRVVDRVAASSEEDAGVKEAAQMLSDLTDSALPEAFPNLRGRFAHVVS